MSSMLKIPFEKFDAGGNPTVIIDNTSRIIPRELYAHLAAMVMKEPFVGSEQVGYWEPPTRADSAGRLFMMGGELCINGLRCFGLMRWEKLVGTHFVETSGLRDLVSIEILSTSGPNRVAVKLPIWPHHQEIRDDLFMVRLPGIVHFVWTVDELPEIDVIRRRLEETVQINCVLEADDAGAVGLIALAKGIGTPTIRPLIKVFATNTCIAETSCGSGSIAAHLVLSGLSEKRELAIRQPSGALLHIHRSPEGTSVEGLVNRVATGTLYLDMELARERSGTLPHELALESI